MNILEVSLKALGNCKQIWEWGRSPERQEGRGTISRDVELDSRNRFDAMNQLCFSDLKGGIHFWALTTGHMGEDQLSRKSTWVCSVTRVWLMPQLPLTLEVGAMWHPITLNPGSSLPYILELVLALVGWVRYRPSWTLEHLASWRPSHKFPSNSHLNSNNHPVEKAPAYSPVLAPAYPNIFPNLHYLGLLPRPKIKARTHTL